MDFSTTFWMDFTIADAFGLDAVQDTYDRVFDQWKEDYRYLTDLVITLNHKIWQHWEKDPESPLAALYNELWIQADGYAIDTLKGAKLKYFLEKVD